MYNIYLKNISILIFFILLNLCLNNKLLYKKVGFVLEKFKEIFNINDKFFFECKKQGGNIVGYYNLQAKDSLIFNAKWRLFVYKDMGEV